MPVIVIPGAEAAGRLQKVPYTDSRDGFEGRKARSRCEIDRIQAKVWFGEAREAAVGEGGGEEGGEDGGEEGRQEEVGEKAGFEELHHLTGWKLEIGPADLRR